MIKFLINQYRMKFWNREKFARYIGVELGNNCSINTTSFGSEPYLIRIGNNVQITAGVKFFTHGGGWIFREKYPKMDTFGKIVVGNNVYIGNNVLILPGVTIGDNVIIGAGSIVTKSLESDSVYAGNPARYVSSVEKVLDFNLKFNLDTKGMSSKEKKDLLLSLSDNYFIKK